MSDFFKALIEKYGKIVFIAGMFGAVIIIGLMLSFGVDDISLNQ